MFKFLKEKLKDAVGKFTKDIEEEVQEEVIEEPVKEIQKPKPSIKKEIIKEKTKPDSIPKHEEIVKETIEPDKENTSKTNVIEEEKSSKTDVIEEEKSSKTDVIEEEKSSKTDVIEEEKSSKTNVIEEEKETIEVKKGFFSRFSKNKEEKVSELKIKDEIIEEKPIQETKKGFFSKVTETVTKKKLSEDKFNDLFWDIEIALLESNIAVEVIEKIKNDLRVVLVGDSVSMFKTRDIVFETLQKSIGDLLNFEEFDLLSKPNEKKPYVIAFIGVNGSGKTTNLAKVANYLKANGKEVVIAACDTFRAAAIQQVEDHANNLGIKLIKHDYGADAAAVAFDAIEHAKAKNRDYVLIDTAGRNQTNKNLMEELKKLVRVSKPDLKIFVGDSLTGNDAVEQAKEFDEAVGIDAIILSKVDADEKGGASVSISYVTKKPIIFVGNGQGYNDLIPFKKEEFLEKMGL